MGRVVIRTLAVGVVAMLCGSACTKHAQRAVADYPDSVGFAGFTREEADGTMFWTKRRSPATLGTVRQFYEQLLRSRPGWQPSGADWANDNVDANGQPIDRTRASGKVSFYEEPNASVIEIWEFIPKPH